jgi:HD-GYP domain-containing protein (c-di-GMP phosphodiesterase class II)
MQFVNEKDPETFFHCVRVGRGARLLSEAAGLDEYESKVVEFAGLFHDVGKACVPSEILLKPAKLTEDEFRIMQSHPVKSVQLLEPLQKLAFFKDLIPGVLHHHERIDGKGYPYGLAGDAIPLAARIILIVDTFDAMTVTRPYRKGLPKEAALQEIGAFAGRQFDEHLVKIYLQAQDKWQVRERELAKEMDISVFKKVA